MALRDKFRTDPSAVRDGVWFSYEKNSDGTVPRFKLARMSKHNVGYAKALRKFTQQHTDANGTFDLDTLDEAVAEKAMLDVFCETVLLDFENVQPDDDGKSLQYSALAARALLGNPEWTDLYEDLTKKAQSAASFRQKRQEAELKN